MLSSKLGPKFSTARSKKKTKVAAYTEGDEPIVCRKSQLSNRLS